MNKINSVLPQNNDLFSEGSVYFQLIQLMKLFFTALTLKRFSQYLKPGKQSKGRDFDEGKIDVSMEANNSDLFVDMAYLKKKKD